MKTYEGILQESSDDLGHTYINVDPDCPISGCTGNRPNRRGYWAAIKLPCGAMFRFTVCSSCRKRFGAAVRYARECSEHFHYKTMVAWSVLELELWVKRNLARTDTRMVGPKYISIILKETDIMADRCEQGLVAS